MNRPKAPSSQPQRLLFINLALYGERVGIFPCRERSRASRGYPKRITFSPEMHLPWRRSSPPSRHRDRRRRSSHRSRPSRPRRNHLAAHRRAHRHKAPLSRGSDHRFRACRAACRTSQSGPIPRMTMFSSSISALHRRVGGGQRFPADPQPGLRRRAADHFAFVDTQPGSPSRRPGVYGRRQGAAHQPADNRTTTATLPVSYQKMSLVTGLVSGVSSGFDQALLYGGGAAVALWDLARFRTRVTPISICSRASKR